MTFKSSIKGVLKIEKVFLRTRFEPELRDKFEIPTWFIKLLLAQEKVMPEIG